MPDAFGPFRVLHQIGAGALGPVFRAYDPERDRLVAVKLFRLDIPPERVHQFAADLDTLVAADLTHPAIAMPLAAGMTGLEAYLGQDFVAADSLDMVFREHGPMPASDALRVVTQLASALDFAASGDILHGSLHPRDVLVSSNETRLTGVGIARALERMGASSPLRRPYAAPERAAGRAWDRRADVFSLAVMAHEMIWGHRLAGAGDQAAQTLTEIEGGDLAALRRVFKRALAENRQHRYGSALAFAEALSEAFPGLVQNDGLDLRKSETLDEEPHEVDVSIDVHHANEEQDVADSAVDAPLFSDPRVVEASAEHVLSYVDRVSSAPSSSALEAHDSSSTWMGVRPLALALFLGVAIGFAGGYGLGYQVRPDEMATTINELAGSSSPTLLAMAAEPSGPPPRAFTEENLKSAPAPAAASASGRIVVRTTPAGARVFIDGRDVGRTPITMRNLARGAHDVRIARDGYATVERRVVVSAAKPEPSVTVALARAQSSTPPPAPVVPMARATGALGVDSRPAGASVFVDGRVLGTTPLSLTALAPGEYAVRLEREGYRSWASTVRVVAGEKNRIAASLEGDEQNRAAR